MMRRATVLGAAVAMVAAVGAVARAGEKVSINPGWRFVKEDVKGGEQVGMDDSGWSVVSVPHTYNDVDTFDNFSLSGHRGEQEQWGGVVWYRKTIEAPEAWRGKKVVVEFEGVRQVGEVYLNGVKLGVNKTGFVPFGFDLTPHLKVGQKNVLAVRVDNRFLKDPREADGMSRGGRATTATAGAAATNPLNVAPPAGGLLHQLQQEFNASIPEEVDELRADQIPWNNPHWHPAHGGIYRNVYLHVLDPMHIELPLYSYLQTAGAYVWTSDVSEKSAAVHVELPVVNGRGTAAEPDVAVRVLNREGKEVAQLLKQGGRIEAGATGRSTFAVTVPRPELWEPGYPYLYSVVCEVREGGKVVDSYTVPLGIRTVKWERDRGFFINGRHLKLRGWGQKPTDEWAGLGAAQPDWMHWFTLNLMREAGGNWVRWGHCAGGPSQVVAADRLGILTHQAGVDGEADTVRAAWKLRTQAFRDVVIYYRNNPSVVIWEGGNQKVSREHAAELKGYVTQFDPHGGRAYAHRRADQITAEYMEVGVGTEGGREIKELPVVEGEYNREESPRRVWDDVTPRPLSTDPTKIVTGYPEAAGMTYQLTSEQFAINQIAHWVKKCAPENHAGGANWIFSDSTSGGRVPAEVARASGEVDGVRLPKEAYYVCQVVFDTRPRAHVVGHWNYPAGTSKTIYVAANTGGAVELLVNGKVVGKDGEAKDGYLYEFPGVKFEAGAIEARAYGSDGKVAATHLVKTAGEPARVRLTPIMGPGGWRADGSDVLLVDAEVVDKDGVRCPTFYGGCAFDVSGPGVWRGGYNSGRPGSVNGTTLDLECGINRVAVRSTFEGGKVRVRARVAGLEAGEIEVEARKLEVAGGITKELPAMPGQGRLEKSAAEEVVRVGRAAEGVKSELVSGFSYTGPTAGARVERFEGGTAKVWTDREVAVVVPEGVSRGEVVRVPSGDQAYSALDLIQFNAVRDVDLYVAFDDRMAKPKWLDAFERSGAVKLGDAAGTWWKRSVKKGESVTLGGNTDSGRAEGEMYGVVVVERK